MPSQNTADQRIHERVKCLVKGLYFYQNREKTAIATDFSKGGAFFQSNLIPSIGHEITFEFPPKGNRKDSVFMKGKVIRRVEKATSSDPIRGFAVKWDKVFSHGGSEPISLFFIDVNKNKITTKIPKEELREAIDSSEEAKNIPSVDSEKKLIISYDIDQVPDVRIKEKPPEHQQPRIMDFLKKAAEPDAVSPPAEHEELERSVGEEEKTPIVSIEELRLKAKEMELRKEKEEKKEEEEKKSRRKKEPKIKREKKEKSSLFPETEKFLTPAKVTELFSEDSDLETFLKEGIFMSVPVTFSDSLHTKDAVLKKLNPYEATFFSENIPERDAYLTVNIPCFRKDENVRLFGRISSVTPVEEATGLHFTITIYFLDEQGGEGIFYSFLKEQLEEIPAG
jgi:hypothetical protein